MDQKTFNSINDPEWYNVEIIVDRNDLGQIILDLECDKGTSAYRALNVWFERDVAFDMATEILKKLAVYPNDNGERLDRGLGCCCEHYKKNDGIEESKG